MVKNIKLEQQQLTAEVWRYILDNEVKAEISAFLSQKSKLEKAIANIKEQIKSREEEAKTKVSEIEEMEKNRSGIQPTINDINSVLRAFGFTGFLLAKSELDQFYKIQRPDGSDAMETLSEGEKTFITFLYFYHLLKGSNMESGISASRVVVFDDPVSSLDDDVLFIVSTLIKKVFEGIRNREGEIKQAFVLTHNVYFHKEVSFNPKRPADRCLGDETFWTVRKLNQKSALTRHESNPVKTSYELLWNEIKKPDRESISIQNTMRRILENYLKILGSLDKDVIVKNFEGPEKQLCQSLFSWINDGSHIAHDSLYISVDDSTIEAYLRVFRRVFEVTGQVAHYRMMMGEADDFDIIGSAESMDSSS
jgi:wobble nucleotide-excising tRNase